MREGMSERLKGKRESHVFGSRTTHVTRPAPLCFSHTVWHDRSYIHTITFTFTRASVCKLPPTYDSWLSEGHDVCLWYCQLHMASPVHIFYKAAQNILVAPSFYSNSQSIEELIVLIFVAFSGWWRHFIFHKIFYILGSWTCFPSFCPSCLLHLRLYSIYVVCSLWFCERLWELSDSVASYYEKLPILDCCCHGNRCTCLFSLYTAQPHPTQK